MKTINHPDWPEQLYYLDEQETQNIEIRKKNSFLSKVRFTLFPNATCSGCGKRMKKKWMNLYQSPPTLLFLVCDDCHLYVETEISTD